METKRTILEDIRQQTAHLESIHRDVIEAKHEISNLRKEIKVTNEQLVKTMNDSTNKLAAHEDILDLGKRLEALVAAIKANANTLSPELEAQANTIVAGMGTQSDHIDVISAHLLSMGQDPGNPLPPVPPAPATV